MRDKCEYDPPVYVCGRCYEELKHITTNDNFITLQCETCSNMVNKIYHLALDAMEKIKEIESEIES